MDLDPQRYLGVQGKHSDYRSIPSFVPTTASVEEEEVVLGDGVTLKLKNSKPKLENLTPAQWIIGSVRILADIISNTPAPDLRQTVLDYLSHTAKMGELATRYTWASVITLDDEYRRRQAEFNFRWGADTPHMSTLVLRERDRGKPKRPTAPIKPKTMPTCNLFNYGKTCHYGRECRYQHVCAICGEGHARIQHPSQDEGNKRE
jgi:hypothetical protein